MKLYAYARDEKGQDRLIHVWEAERLRREEPEAAERARYFSTELDAAERHEMVLVHREGRLFFRYKELPEGTVSPSAQTLTHLKAKEIISGMRRLRLLLPEGELLLWVENWRPEYRIELPDGALAIADLAGELLASQPPERAAAWKGRLLIEITVTHPSAPERLAALEKLGWPVIEVPIAQGLRIPEGPTVTEEEIAQAEAAMAASLRRGIRANLLADPARPQGRPEGLWGRIRRFVDEMITN